MIIQHKDLHFTTRGNNPNFFEIRQEVYDFVKETGVKDGFVLVQSPHTTCSCFFEEFDHDTDICGHTYLQVDTINGIEKVFPKQKTEGVNNYRYPGPKHFEWAESVGLGSDARWDGTLVNGDAHCKATLIGSETKFVITDGQVATGDVGYIYFVDWDCNQSRNRTCRLTVMGN